jgi:hypothetical protein
MEKEFSIIIDNNVRNFITKLNTAGIKREDIVDIIYKPNNNDYIAIIYK